MASNDLFNNFRMIISIMFLVGTAPVFYTIWFLWKAATLFLPTNVYVAGDDFLYSVYQKLVLFFFETCTGLELILSGDIEEITRKKENVIFMSNHQCSVDWIVADMLAVRQGSIGHLRYILKDSLKYIPLYGAYFRQHSCIYVKRSGQFRSNQAEEQLDLLVRNKTPFWMVVFPEGTRFNPESQQQCEKSQTYAREHGLPVTHHVLTPRSKALYLCVDRLRTEAAALYDVTVAYSSSLSTLDGAIHRKTAPTLSEFLFGVCRQLHVHIERIALDDVPQDNEQFEQWLTERFTLKEKMLSGYYSSVACDSMSTTTQQQPVPSSTTTQQQSVSGCIESGQLVPRSRCHRDILPMYTTLPVIAFWLLVNTPLWFTFNGLIVYIVLSLAGIAWSLGWACLLS